MVHEKQKATDAAFFEDWSEWASLDDLPQPEKRPGWYAIQTRPFSRYYCVLRRRVPWMGGPCFEICLPPNAALRDIVAALPGAAQHPALLCIHRRAHSGLSNTWFIPAENWLVLRLALPAIKRLTIAWCSGRT